jgi:two-component system chemotaxis response regulator CheB
VTPVDSRRLRVLVVDDSPMQGKLLAALLAQDPEIDVVGLAVNGVEALAAISRLKPDVVTLDEQMPVMDGLETARQVMRDWPTPIVMVTSAGGPRGQALAQVAFEAGVLAVQDKRALGAAEPRALAELHRLVKSMAAIRLVRHRLPARPEPDLRGPDDGPGRGQSRQRPSATRRATPEVVAVGASTGGPQAIRDIVSRLPASFPLPILVVQHTTPGYASNLVDWLAAASVLPVRLAEAGQQLDQPGVYVAPTDQHLVIDGRRLGLDDGAPCSLHRPSATVLFRSVARSYGAAAVGVLLTGMGDDGAVGLRELRLAGATTIAQDQASAVVFGMPAEAIRLGAADHVLPPDRIAWLLTELLAGEAAA